LERAWIDLGDAATSRALPAVMLLAENRAEALKLLQRRLKPVTGERGRIAALIEDLDNPKFAIREAAARDLEWVSDLAAPQLREALEAKPPLELRRRLEYLLESSQGRVEADFPWRMQAVRAISVLEHLGGAEAMALLEKVSEGHPRTSPTRAASAALARLKQRPERTTRQEWDDLIGSDVGATVRACLALLQVPARAGGVSAQEVVNLFQVLDGLVSLARGVQPGGSPDVEQAARVLGRHPADSPARRFRLEIIAAVRTLQETSRSSSIQTEVRTLPKAGDEQWQAIVAAQERLAECMMALGVAGERLEAMRECREHEPGMWRGNCDYVVARLYMQQSQLVEYSAMLAQVRKGDLPELDPAVHKGWRLAARGGGEALTDKDGRTMYLRSRKVLEHLAKEHKGTYWAALAEAEKHVSVALRWDPFGE